MPIIEAEPVRLVIARGDPDAAGKGAMNRLATWLLQLAVVLLAASCGDAGDAQPPITPLEIGLPCDVEQGCVAEAEGISLRFSMGPGLRALAPFPVRVELDGGRAVESVTASFAMKGMDMGVNRYRLISDGGRRWVGNVTLPVCTTGRSDWLAELELVTERHRYVVEVPFTLGK